jgi:hypothetical protein
MISRPRVSSSDAFSTIVWVCLSLLLVLSLAPAQGQSARSPLGAFLNGKFPSTTPGRAYAASDAFPALRFEDPIDLVQRPYTPEIWVICQGGQLWCFDKLNPTAKYLVLDLSDVTVSHN